MLDQGWSLITNAQGEVEFDGLPAGARCTIRAGDMASVARASVNTPVKDPVVLDLGPSAGTGAPSGTKP